MSEVQFKDYGTCPICNWYGPGWYDTAGFHPDVHIHSQQATDYDRLRERAEKAERERDDLRQHAERLAEAAERFAREFVKLYSDGETWSVDPQYDRDIETIAAYRKEYGDAR